MKGFYLSVAAIALSLFVLGFNVGRWTERQASHGVTVERQEDGSLKVSVPVTAKKEQ